MHTSNVFIYDERFYGDSVQLGRLYDCAANCLYLFCSLTNNEISYDKSIELLPMTDKGNSMLEVNDALQKCGFETNAKTIKSEDIIKVKSPSIVLNYPETKADKPGRYFLQRFLKKL